MTVSVRDGQRLLAEKHYVDNAAYMEKIRGTHKEPPIFENFDEFEEPSLWVAIATYASFAILIVLGHLRDFLRKRGIEQSHIPVEKGNVVCPPTLRPIGISQIWDEVARSICSLHPVYSHSVTLCQGFISLYADFETFFLRHLYRRSRDCWNRPITGVPGGYFDVLERKSPDFNWTFQYVKKRREEGA